MTSLPMFSFLHHSFLNNSSSKAEWDATVDASEIPNNLGCTNLPTGFLPDFFLSSTVFLSKLLSILINHIIPKGDSPYNSPYSSHIHHILGLHSTNSPVFFHHGKTSQVLWDHWRCCHNPWVGKLARCRCGFLGGWVGVFVCFLPRKTPWNAMKNPPTVYMCHQSWEERSCQFLAKFEWGILNLGLFVVFVLWED